MKADPPTAPTPVLAIGGVVRSGVEAKPIELGPDVPREIEAAALVALGIDPHEFTGIAPLEVVGLDVPLTAMEHVFRCDIVRIAEDRMVAARLGLGGEADRLYALIQPTLDQLGLDLLCLTPVDRYLLYRGGWPFRLRSIDPRRLRGCSTAAHVPRGQGDEVIREVMQTSRNLFDNGLQLWIWGDGPRPRLPRLPGGGVIAGGWPAGKGLAKLIGWDWKRRLAEVPGPRRARRVIAFGDGYAAVDEG